jgi:hypothetical protein
MSKDLFLKITLVLLLILFTQKILIKPENMLDHDMWSKQAKYFEVNDNRQFDMLMAYGHPGGTLIISTLLFKNILNTEYEKSLIYSIIFMNSLLIFVIIFLLWKLDKESLWWFYSLIFIIFHKSYSYNTPPSIIATLSVPLQIFYSLYISKKENIKNKDILILGIISGFSIATRLDIGGFAILMSLIILSKKLSVKQMIYSLLITAVFFIIFDPFMWFMPIKHTYDLVHKMTYHYGDFVKTDFKLKQFLSVSLIGILGVILSYISIYNKKIKTILNKREFLILLLGTIIISIIFLTSKYKAERYFFPIFIIWEVIFLHYAKELLYFLSNKYKHIYIKYCIYIIYIFVIITNILIYGK